MSTDQPFEIGLFTFGELTADPGTGRPIDPAVRLREFIELAKIGDQAGLDVFGVGEHHRPDFAIASPAVVLAAVAQATDRIRLTSTVTVLSTADPVKVFEDFAAVDLISGGTGKPRSATSPPTARPSPTSPALRSAASTTRDWPRRPAKRPRRCATCCSSATAATPTCGS